MTLIMNYLGHEIRFDNIELPKCTIQGLRLLMDIALSEEEYIKAALIRDEFAARGLTYNP